MPHRPKKPRQTITLGNHETRLLPINPKPTPTLWDDAKRIGLRVIHKVLANLLADKVKPRHIRKGMKLSARQFRKHKQALKRNPNV